MAHTYPKAYQPICDRFHAASTLKSMNAYRIGYILELWTNLTPPIRGGIYEKTVIEVEEDTASSVDNDGGSDSDCLSIVSSATSLESAASSTAVCHPQKIDFNPDAKDEAKIEGPRGRREKDASHTLDKLSPDAYIASAIRAEIEDGIGAYPSLDPETQQSINLKYRSLHQRVKDEGFYECRYIEYAKEATRYTILFVSSMLALRQGWYMTSACFLGFFWVR
jgi:sphingolipid 8-(E)-desaturase